MTADTNPAAPTEAETLAEIARHLSRAADALEKLCDQGGAVFSPRRPRSRSQWSSRALTAIEAHLSERADPVPTRDLLALVLDLGINVPGKDPRNTLSATIFNAGCFRSHGRAGWSLASTLRSPS